MCVCDVCVPADGPDDAVQFVGGGRGLPPHGEHQVDGVKEAGQGLGQVGRLVGQQGVLQGLLWTTHMNTHTHINTHTLYSHEHTHTHTLIHTHT